MVVQSRDWSPDGRFFIYDADDPHTRRDIWMMPQFGDRKPVAWLATQFDEFDPRISPDGRWLAYTSNESGTNEVYIRAFPTPGRKWPVSTHGGEAPRWRRDGRELFYLTDAGTVMAVPIRTDTSLEPGRPAALFSAVVRRTRGGPDFEVAGDGQRFLFNQTVADASPITIALNWTAALKK